MYVVPLAFHLRIHLKASSFASGVANCIVSFHGWVKKASAPAPTPVTPAAAGSGAPR